MTTFFDTNGLRLAEVPGSGVAKIDPDTPSGNPRHDTRSGKFSSGGKPKQKQSNLPPNTSEEDFTRMMDAIREAAREFDNPDVGDLQEFIAGRAKTPDQVDVNQFLAAVQQQRLNDLVDILDQQLRQTGPLKRGRRKVRVSAPRGYVRKVLKSLESPQVAALSLRLSSMGHKESDVDSFFKNKFPGQEKEILKAKAQLSDSKAWGTDALFFGDSEEFDADYHDEPVDPIQMAQKIASNLPQPVINVTVEAPKNGKKIVKRDPATGLIESIEDSDVSGS